MRVTRTGFRQGAAKVQKLSERSKSGARAERERTGSLFENKMKLK